MASFKELEELSTDPGMLKRMTAAVIVVAEQIRTEAEITKNHANRVIWAAGALTNPRQEAPRMWWASLAAHVDATVEAIRKAPDGELRADVEKAIDLFATGA